MSIGIGFQTKREVLIIKSKLEMKFMNSDVRSGHIVIKRSIRNKTFVNYIRKGKTLVNYL